MFTRTPDQKKRVEKTKIKNQNHKNQAGQQYTKYYELWRIIMSYEKTSPTKGNNQEKQKKRKKKIPCAQGDGGGHCKRRGCGNKKCGQIGYPTPCVQFSSVSWFWHVSSCATYPIFFMRLDCPQLVSYFGFGFLFFRGFAFGFLFQSVSFPILVSVFFLSWRTL
jgi:hypothetical protein